MTYILITSQGRHEIEAADHRLVDRDGAAYYQLLDRRGNVVAEIPHEPAAELYLDDVYVDPGTIRAPRGRFGRWADGIVRQVRERRRVAEAAIAAHQSSSPGPERRRRARPRMYHRAGLVIAAAALVLIGACTGNPEHVNERTAGPPPWAVAFALGAWLISMWAAYRIGTLVGHDVGYDEGFTDGFDDARATQLPRVETRRPHAPHIPPAVIHRAANGARIQPIKRRA